MMSRVPNKQYRKLLVIMLILLLTLPSARCYSQINKSAIQCGVTFLPVFDIFRMYPGNEIKGIVCAGTFGSFISKDLSFGVNPFFGAVINTYTYQNIFPERERADLRIVGLNTYLRKYWHTKGPVSFFAMISAGLGHVEEKRLNANVSPPMLMSVNYDPVYTLQAGGGVEYSLGKIMTIELNVPFVLMRYAQSSRPYLSDFRTVVPTIGAQFYFNRTY